MQTLIGVCRAIGRILANIWRFIGRQKTINVMLTTVLAVVAYEQWWLANDRATSAAREEFDHALDDAEALCGHCTCNGPSCGTWFLSSCTPSYLIAVPLDKAVRNEPRTADRLTAVEYNRLAILGSSVWSFERTKRYVDKAIRVGRDPLDGFLSHLLMGHIYFRYLADLPDTANIETARNEFTEAIACLRQDTDREVVQFYTGYGYAIWAAHEQFLNHDAECNQKRSLALAWWQKLSDEKDGLRNQLDDIIDRAKGDEFRQRRRPEIACLFRQLGNVPPNRPQPIPARRPSTEPTMPIEPAPAAPIPAPSEEKGQRDRTPTLAPPKEQGRTDKAATSDGLFVIPRSKEEHPPLSPVAR